LELRARAPLKIYFDDYNKCDEAESELVRKIALATEPCDFPMPLSLALIGKDEVIPQNSKTLIFISKGFDSVNVDGKSYQHGTIVHHLNAVVISHPCEIIKNVQLKISAWKAIQNLGSHK
jgi:hypothetical protein